MRGNSLPQKEAYDLLFGANHSYIPEKLIVAAFEIVSHADGRNSSDASP